MTLRDCRMAGHPHHLHNLHLMTHHCCCCCCRDWTILPAVHLPAARLLQSCCSLSWRRGPPPRTQSSASFSSAVLALAILTCTFFPARFLPLSLPLSFRKSIITTNASTMAAKGSTIWLKMSYCMFIASPFPWSQTLIHTQIISFPLIHTHSRTLLNLGIHSTMTIRIR